MTLRQAIDQSIRETRTVDYTWHGDSSDLAAELFALGYDSDSTENGDALDVWSTEGDEWRLRVRCVLEATE